MPRAIRGRPPTSAAVPVDPWEGTDLDIYRSNFIGVARQIRALLAKDGLQLTDFKALHFLRSGTERPTALAASLDLTPAAATQILDRFERKGLARREADPRDRRATSVRLTAEGVRVYERAALRVREFVVALAGAMSREGIEALRLGSEELGRALARQAGGE